MIQDKELYEDVIKILDILSDRKELEYFTGYRLLGGSRWVNVHQWLQSNCGEAFVYESTSLTYILFKKEYIEGLRTLCLKSIEHIDQEKRYRELNTKYLKCQIWYAKWAVVISAISIVVSIVALVVSMSAAT